MLELTYLLVGCDSCDLVVPRLSHFDRCAWELFCLFLIHGVSIVVELRGQDQDQDQLCCVIQALRVGAEGSF